MQTVPEGNRRDDFEIFSIKPLPSLSNCLQALHRYVYINGLSLVYTLQQCRRNLLCAYWRNYIPDTRSSNNISKKVK